MNELIINTKMSVKIVTSCTVYSDGSETYRAEAWCCGVRFAQVEHYDGYNTEKKAIAALKREIQRFNSEQ